jgi:UTP:GlnB (protein PII) uridylyltransferase
MSLEEAAAHGHAEVATVSGYLRDSRFQEFLTEFNSEIESKVIERVVRRRTRALAKLQVHAEDAVDVVIGLMNFADRDSVRLTAAKGVLKQTGIDLDHIGINEEMEDPRKEMDRKDPSFFEFEAETIKELESGSTDG